MICKSTYFFNTCHTIILFLTLDDPDYELPTSNYRLLPVPHSPLHHLLEYFIQRTCRWRQFILDGHRLGIIYGTCHDAVQFKFFQLLRQHTRRNALDIALDLGEPFLLNNNEPMIGSFHFPLITFIVSFTASTNCTGQAFTSFRLEARTIDNVFSQYTKV